MSDEKLQKIMSRAGFGSRRENEKYIEAGRVRVNGKVARIGDRANAYEDEITVDGDKIKLQKPIYVMLNKPKGVLSSTEDELNEGRPTVRDLVSLKGHLYPVGRLDMNSEGLILLTNDGELANALTHPRYGHEKVYRVWVERKPNRETLTRWRNGVMLEEKKTLPAKVEVMKDDKYVVELQIVMKEGRKRQIRRVASILGHPVRRLFREKIGPLRISNVQPGQWRMLTEGEVQALKKSIARSKRQAGLRGQGGNRNNDRRPSRRSSSSSSNRRSDRSSSERGQNPSKRPRR